MNNFNLRFNTYYRLGWLEYSLLFLMLFLGFYFGMGTYAIENINEGLYAEIPREMLQAGSYIIPKLNFVPYIEKPPLFYWLVVLSYKIFGVSAWSARIVPATAASLVCLNLVHFGHILRRNREGWLAAIMLATSIGFIAIARMMAIDMVFTYFFTATLLYFYIWYKNFNNIYLRLFYLFTGLAFLTKGLLALILIPAIIIIFIISLPQPSKVLLRFFDPIGLALFAIVVVPWHYLAIKQQAGFIQDYFQQIPYSHKTDPVYFSLPKILLYLFPWSLLAFLLIRTDRSVEKSLYRFLWLWFAVPFIYFSLVQAKSDYYLVMAAPPLAMLLALKINQVFHLRNNKTFLYFFSLLGCLESVAFGLVYLATSDNRIAGYLPDFLKLDASFNTPLLFLWLSAMLITLIGLFVYMQNPRKLMLQFSGIIVLIVCLTIFYVVNKQKIEYRHSEMQIAKYIAQHGANRPIYLYKDYEKVSSILFYLKKRLPLIDSTSQGLEYGMRSPMAKGWFFSLNNFLQARDKETHYVLARKDNFLEFMHLVAPRPYYIVAQSGSSVLMSNQLPAP
jgi:4-amino-4-deoxy-L-arabinose transferase-like glycosyltransferase